MSAGRRGGDSRPLVGVFPRAAREQRRRLFDALEQALDVRFVGRGPGEQRELSAAISFGEPGHPGAAGDFSEPPAAADYGEPPAAADYGEPPATLGVPRLELTQAVEGGGDPALVDFDAVPALDRRLHGRQLGEAGASSLPALIPASGEVVVARHNGRALWVADRGQPFRQRAVVGPAELGPDEVLRDRLRDGRCLALLPILELGRGAAGARRWQAPALRASFLLDDPNLHWPSYGHVNFHALARDARRHGYHVAMATVPLDAWMVHPGARDAFARHPQELSLIIHGNDHVRRELGRPRSDPENLALARQALQRAHSLERRARVPVTKIMAPPHGVCSEAMARALLRAGFEALTISNVYPWLERLPAQTPLAGWRPAEFVAGGLPIIERRPMRASLAELSLLAYLDHPLVVFGHHDDVVGGPERLRAIRDQLATLGPIRWESPHRLAGENFMARADGDTVHLRLFSRRIELELPVGVQRLVVELPGHPCPSDELVCCGPERVAPGEPLPVTGGTRCRVSLRHADEVHGDMIGHRRRASIRVWPVVRRGMVEARDRTAPLSARIAARRQGSSDGAA